MRRVPLRAVFGTATVALAALLSSAGRSATQEKPTSEDSAAVERARKTVRMLDDVYKTAIVLITDKYVRDKKDYPAGRAAVNWFKAISDKGWHDIRIIDATGDPYNPVNVAKDDFDKEGIRQLKTGKAFYDQVTRINGKAYLRAITPIPVVMEKCTMCHANYKTVKAGEPIGALTYKVPIE
ncbi:MAG: DUF3365 domain-containing protein [Planctomycetes bacterium]|nr:DUF3365 domain-containing protein [Planctomycetota bacterium]